MSTVPTQNSSKEPVVIFDTTLRDGDQSPGYALRLSEKVMMAHAIAKMGVDVIEAGFPISSDLDFEAVKTIAEEVDGPRIAALARASQSDIACAAAALMHCSRPRIHTFIATSNEHMRNKLGKTPDEVLCAIDKSVGLAYKYMKGRGDVQWSAEDASRSSIDFLITAVGVAINAGATTINLPDTLGYTQPEEHRNMFKQVMTAVQPAPHVIFSTHTHNDLGIAEANAMAAIHGGARQVEVTVKGIGERAGNAQIDSIIALMDVRGDINPFICNIDRRQMKRVADLHTMIVGQSPSTLPVVGDNAFAHGSGIHQNGMIKAGCYEIMIPTDYGHEEGTSYPLTRHSGETGINEVLQRNGITLSVSELGQFVEIFKAAASEALEKEGIRVVHPHKVCDLARRHMRVLVP